MSISLFTLSCQCFTGDTLVSTETGDVRIDEIRPGDKVWTNNVETGEKELQEVKSVKETKTDIIVHVITDDGNEIQTTMFHPFYVKDESKETLGNWVAASSLKKGDELLTEDGKNIKVSEVRVQKLDEEITVYNLEITEVHTYYVAGGVLVHNACADAGGSRKNTGEGGSDFGNYQFKEGVDIDLRGKGTYKDSLDIAFEKTGIPKEDFTVTKWGKDKYGKSFPVEWKAKNGYEVNIDIGHSPSGNAPTVSHIGWQTAGKRGNGGGTRGHIFVDDVPYNR